MNISNNVCENWNSNNPSMVSFVGLESNNQKQFWDWETNNHNNTTITTTTTTNNNNPFISNHPTTNIFDCSNISSSPPSIFAANCLSTTQFADYHASSTDFMKKEADYHGSGGRIGLNLGHRTYFSSREIGLMDRLYKRPRGFYQANQIPRCQAEGCKIDLTNAKHYHRRHKVCELHSKATKVVAGGREQRFCQQCSRFHVLAEFDESKRSCRKRLADHNRRRRKLQPGPTDSVSTQISENAFPHVGPSSSRPELKVTSLSSSTILPSMISASTTRKSSTINAKGTIITGGPPSLSLGGQQLQQHQQHQQHHISSSSSYTTTNQRPFIINHDSTPLFDRENTVAPYHNLFFTSSNEASQSTTTGGGSDHHSQHPEELQNLLHLRQAMFEIELL